MKQVIWKSAINVFQLVDHIQSIDLLIGAKILGAREQGDSIAIWYLCDPEAEKRPRKIAIYGTGHGIGPPASRVRLMTTTRSLMKACEDERKRVMADMPNHEAVQMMARCSSEIKMLRAEIDRLAPKAQAYDDMHALIRFLPQSGIASSEDLAWALDKRIKELTETAKASPSTAD